jgi:ADP-ribose pyrophosphatase YjhB (NUDIX family)
MEVGILLGILSLIGIPLAFPGVRKRVEALFPSRRPEVAVAVVLRGDEVLLVKRRDSREDLGWMFPSGELGRRRRSYEAKAVSEVFSETNVDCEVVEEIGKRIHPETGKHCIYYRCKYKRGEATNKDPDENEKVAWLPVTRAIHLIGDRIDPNVLSLLRCAEGRKLGDGDRHA